MNLKRKDLISKPTAFSKLLNQGINVSSSTFNALSGLNEGHTLVLNDLSCAINSFIISLNNSYSLLFFLSSRDTISGALFEYSPFLSIL